LFEQVLALPSRAVPAFAARCPSRVTVAGCGQRKQRACPTNESEAMFGLGHWELLIVALVLLILFGHRLPSVMRSLGRGVVEFKEGMAGIGKDYEPGEKKDA
jgi:sec-independent protein translocase protein TatA